MAKIVKDKSGKSIKDYSDEYYAAAARGDTAGMQRANDAANEIRRQNNEREEKATEHINNVASENRNKGGARVTYVDTSKFDDDGGGGYDDSKPQGAKYDGPYGDTPIRPLDSAYYEKESYYQKKYDASRAAGDVKGMREANDGMNQVRNDYGLAAQRADADIAYIKQLTGYNQNGGYSGGGGGGGGSGSYSGGNYSAGLSGPGAPSAGTSGGGVNDFSDYIADMNQAAQDAALAELRAAFDRNMSAIDAAGNRIAPSYQAARNQAAGNAELQRRQFAEFAAANGLNSGAAGQAQLAMGNALQSSLSGIDTAESDALSQLELQRTQTQTDYNNAIAKAQASGDYELAKQLYAEKVRVDEALRQQIAQAAEEAFRQQSLNFQRDQQAWQNQFSERQFQSGLDLQSRSELMQIARDMAAYGDFSGYEALGVDSTAMRENWNREREMDAYRVYDSGGSGVGSGLDRKSEPNWDGLFQAAYESGHPQSFISNNYKNFGFSSSSGLWGDYQNWTPEQQDTQKADAYFEDGTQMSAGYSSLWAQVRNMFDSGRTRAEISSVIYNALVNNRITQAEANRMLKSLGME